MRRLFITHIIFCLFFLPFQSFALVSGAATRASTGIISSISSAGATYGGASGSKIVATATRSFASGYAASASGVIASGAAGGYEATASVALSRGATGGLLRLAFQGAAAGSRMIPYVGAVIMAAQLAGMAWQWYTDSEGKSHFVQTSSGMGADGLIASTTITFSEPVLHGTNTNIYYNKQLLLFNSLQSLNASFGTSTSGSTSFTYYGSCSDTTNWNTCNNGIPLAYNFASQFPGYSVNPRVRLAPNNTKIGMYCDPALPLNPSTTIPVPWDDVQKAIEDDLGNRPNEWSDPFDDAMKEVPPAVNPWLDQTSKEDAAKPAPNPMPDNLPYPTPNNTPTVPHPSTGEPVPAPLPNELTKEDISKIASEILSSMTPAQTNNVATGDVTQPAPNQDLATQISNAVVNNTYNVNVQGSPNVNVVNTPNVNVVGLPGIASQLAQINANLLNSSSDPNPIDIPQPPYDVTVINEPTIKIKTEDVWKSDAEIAVGSDTQPDSNEDLDLNLDLEKYKSKKRDLAFLDTIYTNIKSLPLFQLFEKTPISVSGGSSQFCLDVPQFGQHCIDLDDYSNSFDALGSVSIALCFFACLAIIFL